MPDAEHGIKKHGFSWFNIAFVATILVLIFLPLMHINLRDLPYIYNDEFGYWFNAAEFNGLNWSETFSKISYYSFGYSLILAILMAVFQDMSTAYHIAVFLNGVWLALEFFFLYKAARLIYSKQKNYFILIVALIATLFSSNFVQSNYTWPEIFLCMLFSLMFYLIISILKSPSSFKMALLALIAIYSYYVHQRTLGIVLAILLISVFLIIFKKINLKEWLCFVLVFVSCFVIMSLLKSNVINSFWENSSTVSGNNFSGQTSKILSLFSLEGLYELLLSVFGKLYYIFAASFLIVPYACYVIFSKWIMNIHCKSDITNNMVLGFFLLFSIVFSLGINSVFMLVPDSVTHLVYGRYIDNLFGPFLLIGIMELMNHKVSYYVNMYLICIFSAVSFVVFYTIDLYGLNIHESINNIGISYLVNSDGVEIGIGFFTVSVIWILINLIKKVFSSTLQPFFYALILISVFAIIGNDAYQEFEEKSWNEASISSKEMAQIIERISADELEVEVYAIMDDESRSYPERYPGNGIQFLLKDQVVHSISKDEAKIRDWSGNYIVISSSKLSLSSKTFEESKIIYNDGIYKLQISSNLEDIITGVVVNGFFD